MLDNRHSGQRPAEEYVTLGEGLKREDFDFPNLLILNAKSR